MTVGLPVWNLDHRSLQWNPFQVGIIWFLHWVSDPGRMAIKLTFVPTGCCVRDRKVWKAELKGRTGLPGEWSQGWKPNRPIQQVVKMWTKAELLQTAFQWGRGGCFACRAERHGSFFSIWTGQVTKLKLFGFSLNKSYRNMFMCYDSPSWRHHGNKCIFWETANMNRVPAYRKKVLLSPYVSQQKWKRAKTCSFLHLQSISLEFLLLNSH